MILIIYGAAEIYYQLQNKYGVMIMKKIIDSAVSELIKIIDSKNNSKKVAWQFILEELDAALKWKSCNTR